MIIPPRDAFAKWLADEVAGASPGKRLASHRELAQRWNLSETTVRAVASTFVRRGKLVCIPGKGTFIGGPPRDEPPSPPRSSVESLISALSHALVRGELKRGDALPPVKMICLQYHVTPATVAAAYRGLECAGLVIRVGRRYWAGGLTTTALRSRGDRILLFYDSNEGFARFLETCVWRDGLFEMESELHSCGFRLTFRPLETLHHWWERERGALEGVHGVVVASESAARLSDESAWLAPMVNKRIAEPLRILFAGGRPARVDRRFHHFVHGHIPTVRAREVARFCGRHRVHTLNVFIDTVTGRPSAARDALRLVPETTEHAAGVRVRFVLPASAGAPDGGTFVDILGRAFSTKYLESIAGDGGPNPLGRLVHMVDITPGLEQALDQSADRSLWYFLNSDIAAQAARWCVEHGRPPERLSILAAANTPICYELGISSCVTDWRTIGYLIAHTLIGDIPVEKTRKGYIRTRAGIYERLTTP